MAHSQHHPVYVDGCFGCKVASVGYDGRHYTRTTVTRTDVDTGKVTEHRSGRRDVQVHPRTLKIRTYATN